ncbi:putative membrane protein [Helicobacter pylori NQ4044]|uniref:Putative membrane protein n=1 Tax=Helicobacter pylori NQ4044 TaxID=992028 RepID=J0J2V8_HELPX|nr:putative membrane protein [Helicobacter pylori NQ4044]
MVVQCFLMFFIFLAWLVPPCCGVGAFQTPPLFLSDRFI